MYLQQTLNKLKRIEDVVMTETAINAKGAEISVIQKAIQLAKELIKELED